MKTFLTTQPGVKPILLRVLTTVILLLGIDQLKFNRRRAIAGTPEHVKRQLNELAKAYNVDEIIAANITLDLEDRVESYRLLAEIADGKRETERG